ncbi:unnamed protein product [Periconia digitata]|uniref:F-box domain-containing protein n=1 Tax=Periconia digitata TaxID=1303443 RepID=A0A9W4XVE4_9PLEO|nr:unnamed protein product [Periconia digitata]
MPYQSYKADTACSLSLAVYHKLPVFPQHSERKAAKMDRQKTRKPLTYGPDTAVPRGLSLENLYSICPYRIELHDSLPAATYTGPLLSLPSELLFAILEQLPIISLLKCRSTSQYARYVVDSMSSFRGVVCHARLALYKFLVLKPSKVITISDLFSKLRQKGCDSCGATTAYLWIPTASRICLVCLRSRASPCPQEELSCYFRLSEAEISALPDYTVPKTIYCYHRAGRQSHHLGHQSIRLFDTERVADLVLQRCGYSISKASMLAPITYDNLEYSAAIDGGNPRIGTMILGDDRWMMAVAVMPTMIEGKVETGRYCATCLYTECQDRMYTREEFKEHLKTCRARPRNNDCRDHRESMLRRIRHTLSVGEDDAK